MPTFSIAPQQERMVPFFYTHAMSYPHTKA